MASIKCGNCRGTHGSVADVKSCYGVVTGGTRRVMRDDIRDGLKADREDRARYAAQVEFGTSAPKAKLQDGFYTVVFADDSYRTLRVRTQAKDARFAPGEQVVAFLSGSDNESDYQGFAFLKPNGTFNVWKRFKENDSLARALQVLVTVPEAAGQEYALRSGRCRRCNRTLTVPASINRGFGPDCAEMVGVA